MIIKPRLFALLIAVLGFGVMVAGCSGGDDIKPLAEDPGLKELPPGPNLPRPGAGDAGGPGAKKGGG